MALSPDSPSFRMLHWVFKVANLSTSLFRVVEGAEKPILCLRFQTSIVSLLTLVVRKECGFL